MKHHGFYFISFVKKNSQLDLCFFFCKKLQSSFPILIPSNIVLCKPCYLHSCQRGFFFSIFFFFPLFLTIVLLFLIGQGLLDLLRQFFPKDSIPSTSGSLCCFLNARGCMWIKRTNISNYAVGKGIFQLKTEFCLSCFGLYSNHNSLPLLSAAHRLFQMAVG